MIERSVILKAHEVRAILDGRKTKTRRVVKPQPDKIFDRTMFGGAMILDETTLRTSMCPYGARGDRLWVRETFAPSTSADTGKPHAVYAASGHGLLPGQKWTPSIHMPRWASRITLEVTCVRVERLNAISEEDAVAEGVEVHMMPEEWRAVRQQYGRNEAITFDREPSADLIAALRLRDVTHVPARPMRSAAAGFHSLWESINGTGSWAENPWVWRIEFRRVTP